MSVSNNNKNKPNEYNISVNKTDHRYVNFVIINIHTETLLHQLNHTMCFAFVNLNGFSSIKNELSLLNRKNEHNWSMNRVFFVE